MTSPLAIARDVVLLLVGTAGVVHQEFFRQESDPALLMFYAAIFGLTAFLPAGVADALRANRTLPPGESDERP
jgi:hypothetical protein